MASTPGAGEAAAEGHYCRPQFDVTLPPTPDGGAFREWQGHLSSGGHIDLINSADLPAFHAAARLYFLGPVILSDSSASHAVRSVRSPEHVIRTNIDHLLISLHIAGSYVGHCGGRPYRAGPGDICFLDYGLPFDFEISAYRSLALMIPRSALPTAMRGRALHGLVPPADAPATRLLAQTYREFYAALPRLSEAQATIGVRALIELSDLASQVESKIRDAASPAQLDLFGRAQVFIERNLGDTQLSATRLARGLNVSRNALYDAFAGHGGVLAYIRERRLQHCSDIFTANIRTEDTIATIALSLGFRSEAHFSRAFKERFGLTPRAMRALGRGGNLDTALLAKAEATAPYSLQKLGR